MSTLAARVQARLDIDRKLTKAGLAKAAGISPPAISRWLNGNTREILAKNVFAAAHYLRCRPEWLADGSGQAEISTDTEAKSKQVFIGVREDRAIYASKPDWPFEDLSPATWHSLLEREKGKCEQVLITAIQEIKSRRKSDAA